MAASIVFAIFLLSTCCLCQNETSDLFASDFKVRAAAANNIGKPSFILIVRKNKELSKAIHDIITVKLDKVERDIIGSDPKYFRNYILGLFGSPVEVSTKSFQSMKELKNELDKAMTSANSIPNCEDSVFTAISALKEVEIGPYSHIYVFTDAVPNDGEDLREAARFLVQKQLIVSVFLLESKRDSPCNLRNRDQGFHSLTALTDRTAGLVLYLENRDISKADSYFLDYTQYTLYRRTLVYAENADRCASMPGPVVFRGGNAKYFAVLATATDSINLTLTGPDGKQYRGGMRYFRYTKKPYSFFCQIFRPNPGDWMVFTNASGNQPCHIRVFAETKDDTDESHRLQFSYLRIGDDIVVPSMVPYMKNRVSVQIDGLEYNETVQAEIETHTIKPHGHLKVHDAPGKWNETLKGFSFNDLTCDPGEIVDLTVTVKVEDKAVFQRAGVSYCDETLNPCQHGSRYDYGIGKCNCQLAPHWEGYYCDVIKCENGGKRTKENTCICPADYTGPHCLTAICPTKAPIKFSFEKRTFSLVVQATSGMMEVLKAVGLGLEQGLTAARERSANWFSKYELVVFNDRKVLKKTSSTSIDDFVKAYKDNTKIEEPSGKCEAAIYGALDNAMEELVSPGSFIWLISRGLPNDDEMKLNDTFFTLAKKRPQIFNFVVNDVKSGCPVTIESQSFSSYAILMKKSANFLSVFPSDSLDTVKNAMLLYLPTFFNSYCASSWSTASSAHERLHEIYQEPHSEMIYVNLYSSYAAMAITDAEGDPRSYQTRLEVDDGVYTQRLVAKKITDDIRSPLTVSLVSPRNCLRDVYVTSPFRISYGFIQCNSIEECDTKDVPTDEPIYGVINRLVLHVDEGLSISSIAFYGNSMTIKKDLNKRQGCTYQYMQSGELKCPQHQSALIVQGKDNGGRSFERLLGALYCFKVEKA